MASKIIEINPITRVEGHGKVTIQLDDAGNAVSARFHNTQFRGFEKFCEGQVFQEMPNLTPRICGICPVSHQLASAKACDMILGVELTRPAKLLRELLHLGQFIQSHALHFFHLASPDFLLGFDSDPATRNVIGLIGADPGLATEAVKLRSYGQTIIKKLGGKKIHMNAALPGGMTTALLAEDRDYLLKQIDWALADAQLAVKILLEYVGKNSEMINSFATFPSAYMGMVDQDNNLALYDGNLRLVDSKGVVLEDQFNPVNYLDIIAEYVEDWTYMKFPFYKKLGYPGGTYRAGPLGRLNVATGITTPLANAEFKNYKKLSKNGLVEGSMYFHYARLIELIYSIEKTREILEDKDVLSTDLQVTSRKYNEQGVGVVEAPRGTLFHHYWVDDTGKLTGVNLIVATGNNNAAMNRSVYEVAKDYIKNGNVTEGILNRVEAAIRCYDPCLSCSTHALGQMPLLIQLRTPGGEIAKQIYS
ncbi:MAG: Ni/Fe hydrogenase subunit alpha [Dehalococcoidia bacterium]|nr:MAG: Ni/Fe hydrogenase subunit alpha [Dehalococcoidia bacterium]